MALPPLHDYSHYQMKSTNRSCRDTWGLGWCWHAPATGISSSAWQRSCSSSCPRETLGSWQEGEGSLGQPSPCPCPSATAPCPSSCQSWCSQWHLHPDQGVSETWPPDTCLAPLSSYRLSTLAQKMRDKEAHVHLPNLLQRKWQLEWPIIIELFFNEMLVLYTTTQRTYVVASD